MTLNSLANLYHALWCVHFGACVRAYVRACMCACVRDQYCSKISEHMFNVVSHDNNLHNAHGACYMEGKVTTSSTGSGSCALSRFAGAPRRHINGALSASSARIWAPGSSVAGRLSVLTSSFGRRRLPASAGRTGVGARSGVPGLLEHIKVRNAYLFFLLVYRLLINIT